MDDFGVILGSFWVILGSLGCQIGAKIGLEASGGPHGSPKGPLRAQGCHFGRFWGHFGVILGAFWWLKSCQNRYQKSLFFRAWILSDFGVFRGAFLHHFLMFLGLATTDREKPGYVKFVDSIEEFVDFQKTQGHTFQQKLKISCLGICCFFGIVSGRIFVIFGLILRVILGLKHVQK